ncbi:ferredoxin [uncultured Jatrophihabitans sp.]|uniref:ferredoxin n=1 Tax=uncultured Jatrophihabitans sp. TaxID=1610747 RepID=UPI0035CAE274
MDLLIDRVRCDGHGVCAALLPDGIALDEWGFPVLHGQHVDDADVEAVGAARRTVAACPALALRLATTTSAAGR